MRRVTRRNTMANLFCFGLGYTARHFIADFAIRFDRIAGTVRDHDNAARIARDGLAGTDHLLVSVPPDPQGDPVLRHYAEALARASRLRAIVYLSTIGVYGDHG